VTINTFGARTLTVTDTVKSTVTGKAVVSTAPKAPSTLTATIVSSSRIDLTWTDNSTNETGFLVERCRDGVHWTQVASLGANATSYRNTGLSANTRYYFRVRAVSTATNPAVYSAYSNVATATTPAG
jgi:titin